MPSTSIETVTKTNFLSDNKYYIILFSALLCTVIGIVLYVNHKTSNTRKELNELREIVNNQKNETNNEQFIQEDIGDFFQPFTSPNVPVQRPPQQMPPQQMPPPQRPPPQRPPQQMPPQQMPPPQRPLQQRPPQQMPPQQRPSQFRKAPGPPRPTSTPKPNVLFGLINEILVPPDTQDESAGKETQEIEILEDNPVEENLDDILKDELGELQGENESSTTKQQKIDDIDE